MEAKDSIGLHLGNTYTAAPCWNNPDTTISFKGFFETQQYRFPLFMKDRLEIKEYFSDKELIKILCDKRAIAAKKGHHISYSIISAEKQNYPSPKKSTASPS